MSDTLRTRIKDRQLIDLLEKPVGAPLPLSREQAIAIVEAGMGMKPDLPAGKDYVRRVKKIWQGLLANG